MISIRHVDWVSRRSSQRARRFGKGANGPTAIRFFNHSSQPRALGVRSRMPAIWVQFLLMVRFATALRDRKRRIGKIPVQGGNNLSTLANRPADALD
jgi:hypothetical protein